MSSSPSPSTPAGAGRNKAGQAVETSSDAYRVMVVDDSTVVRGLIAQTLRQDPDIDVVVTAPDGAAALRLLDRHDIEVIVLDIEMPVMDGLTALPKLKEKKPDLKIIMASTLTRKNAEISFKALSLGASDYIPKPSTSREVSGGVDFKTDLVSKVKAHGRRGRARTGGGAPSPAPASAPGAPSRTSAMPTMQGREVSLRASLVHSVSALAIGSSTGGPQALFKLFTSLPADLGLPIFVTQHMPPTFTEILAQHITKQTRFLADEGRDGVEVVPGQVYVAPGDYHMGVEMTDGKAVIRLAQDPPENFCRPAVDYMFRSLLKAYGNHILAVVLTGMGQDGMLGAQEIVKKGGTVIAQDEATSVVWGMPGAVATAGVCSAILPIEEIGEYMGNFAKRRKLGSTSPVAGVSLP